MAIRKYRIAIRRPSTLHRTSNLYCSCGCKITPLKILPIISAIYYSDFSYDVCQLSLTFRFDSMVSNYGKPYIYKQLSQDRYKNYLCIKECNFRVGLSELHNCQAVPVDCHPTRSYRSPLTRSPTPLLWPA